MSRLQIVIAVGLFLIVGLFGWQTYLEKSAKKNRIDERGVPESVREGVLKHQKAAQEKAKRAVAAPAKSKAGDNSDATRMKVDTKPTALGETEGAETKTPSKSGEKGGKPAQVPEAN